MKYNTLITSSGILRLREARAFVSAFLDGDRVNFSVTIRGLSVSDGLSFPGLAVIPSGFE